MGPSYILSVIYISTLLNNNGCNSGHGLKTFHVNRHLVKNSHFHRKGVISEYKETPSHWIISGVGGAPLTPLRYKTWLALTFTFTNDALLIFN